MFSELRLARVTPMLGPKIPTCIKHSKLAQNSNPPHFVPEMPNSSIENYSLEKYATWKVGQRGRNKGQTTGEIVRQLIVNTQLL